MRRCPKCLGSGYVLVYRARVIREYCECPAGMKTQEALERSLRKNESRRSGAKEAAHPASRAGDHRRDKPTRPGGVREMVGDRQSIAMHAPLAMPCFAFVTFRDLIFALAYEIIQK